ncbi:NAD(P)H-hydrate dehydratase [Gillisia sp. M10.2A]|uniref:Bifunctional NAD(P)H-hydrate repair enzyme n=1 Tax=Gillisia lutea TaxID=2909668 RepID=A0ABS9EIT3_9FLAO|nr:NAD(P)H-hydrate dehydratase [Gillisia lutea]MCF4101700.1 NAD(P)H-hydrate dehydratase [Gillisia lutea]
MKIFSVEQLAEADKITIEKQGITSEMLMERAATMVFDEIHKRLQRAPVSIKIFCGIGNNGGDGLVIGRLLQQHGYNVRVFVVNYSNNRSKDFLSNYEKIKENTNEWPILIKGVDDFPEISSGDFVIDAIFGIGLNRPIEGWVALLIEAINKSNAFVLAVDMPSGLFTNKIPSETDAVIRASFTISFQAPKLVFYLPQAERYVGDLQVVDIQLDREYLAKATSNVQLIGKQEAISLYKPRTNFSHKGDYGHSLIIGGSYGKIGSISLTATAALRTGAGLVSIYAPKCGYIILQSVLPEAMVLTDESEEELNNIQFDLEPSVICFGMGAGTSEGTVKTFEALLRKTEKPMVIDADGLNMLSKNKILLKEIPKNSVLTPHPKELERLIGKWDDDFQKLEMAKKFSKEHEIILVIKGAHSITVSGENLYINNTGNPGMATAGAGDVLSGVITGLMSQGYDPLISAVFGIYLHGKAGDIVAEKMSYQGMIAGDIAKHIGDAFLDLFKNEQNSIQN